MAPSGAKTLASVTIAPQDATIQGGATTQLTATAKYSDGSTANVSSQVSWTLSNSALAKVTATGLATGLEPGSVTVTATMSGISSSAQLTIPPPMVTVTSIVMNPSASTISIGSTQQFTATATYSDNTSAVVNTQVSWTSSNPALVTVSATGVATASGSGSATITATLSGVTSSAQITVPAPAVPPPPVTLTAIAVSPSTSSLAIGATQQFTATGTYSDGSTANVTPQVSWTSSNPALAKVSTTGLAAGVNPGTVMVTATLNSKSGSAQITVPQPTFTVTSIALSPSTSSLAVGANQQFTATATNSDGSTTNVTSQVSWSSSNVSLAKVSATGFVTALSTGSLTITATLNGIVGSAQVTVPPPVTVSSIVISPSTSSVVVGATQQFTAIATYSDRSTTAITTQAAWASSNASLATTNSSGLASGLTPGTVTISATFNGTTGNATLNVTPKTISSIAISPTPVSITLGSTQQLTATATYQDGSTGDVSKTVSWTAANQAIVSISATGLATPTAAGTTSVTASLNSVSGSVPITVSVAPETGVSLPTWQGDVQRSGLNAGERSLSPSTVSAKTFGKLFSYQLDGYAYGEPLLISNLTIKGAKHNVLYTATEQDTVYAFDADTYGTGAPLWQTSLLQANETPLTTGPIKPYEGVTSTPVIDTATNTIYVVSTQHSSNGSTFRLNALDITTGAQRPGSPVTVQASVAGTNQDAVNGVVTLTTACIQRAALLLENSTVYLGFSGCHSGWLLGYDAQTLSQTAIFNASPNQNGEGPYASAGGIWMGSGGPAADVAGNIYAVTGNGPWDGKTSWSDTILKFNAKLQITDYFTPQDYGYMNCNDADLSAGGLLLLPETTKALAGGKTGKLYLIDTNNLGQEHTGDTGATQTLFFESDLVGPYTKQCNDVSGAHPATINSYEVFSTAAYFNQSVYLGITPTGANVPAGIRQFTYSSGTLTPSTYTTASIKQSSYGTTPFISANGTSNGIVWMLDHGTPLQSGTPTAATLRAYDANDLGIELYDSMADTADTPGYGIKFSSPIVANGKVYFSTGHDVVTTPNPQGEIDVYGLK